jgi:hypothetical protein
MQGEWLQQLDRGEKKIDAYLNEDSSHTEHCPAAVHALGFSKPFQTLLIGTKTQGICRTREILALVVFSLVCDAATVTRGQTMSQAVKCHQNMGIASTAFPFAIDTPKTGVKTRRYFPDNRGTKTNNRRHCCGDHALQPAHKAGRSSGSSKNQCTHHIRSCQADRSSPSAWARCCRAATIRELPWLCENHWWQRGPQRHRGQPLCWSGLREPPSLQNINGDDGATFSPVKTQPRSATYRLFIPRHPDRFPQFFS